MRVSLTCDEPTSGGGKSCRLLGKIFWAGRLFIAQSSHFFLGFWGVGREFKLAIAEFFTDVCVLVMLSFPTVLICGLMTIVSVSRLPRPRLP